MALKLVLLHNLLVLNRWQHKQRNLIAIKWLILFIGG